MATLRKIFVARTDRLGDVLLTLPAVKAMRERLPETEIDLFYSADLLDLLSPYLDSIGVGAVPYRQSTLLDWTRLLESEAYDGALLLHAPLPLALATVRASVAARGGMLSKAWSFVVLNRGVRQKRSLSEKSEGEYNCEAAEAFLGEGRLPVPQPVYLLGDAASERGAKDLVAKLGVGDRFAVLHPGMGGSALNLSETQYLELIRSWKTSMELPLVASFGPAERDRALQATLLAAEPSLKVISGTTLPVLREVFRQASLVLAPSTGPLHLANYVGTPTVGFYSPVLSHRPQRWQPWGGTGESEVFTPPVDCPGKKDCLGTECPLYFCMERFSWTRPVLEAAGRLLAKKSARQRPPAEGERFHV